MKHHLVAILLNVLRRWFFSFGGKVPLLLPLFGNNERALFNVLWSLHTFQTSSQLYFLLGCQKWLYPEWNNILHYIFFFIRCMNILIFIHQHHTFVWSVIFIILSNSSDAENGSTNFFHKKYAQVCYFKLNCVMVSFHFSPLGWHVHS